MKTIKVGIMPGRINEFAVALGSTIAEVLEIAELSAEGYEVKIDGVTAGLDAVVGNDTNLVLLSKMIKGN